MFIRPQRYRMILSFLLGLLISIGLLIASYFYYEANRSRYEAAIRQSVTTQVEESFAKAHPLALVYVFSRDMKAGEIIGANDLIRVELAPGAIPADVVPSIEYAAGKVMRCNIPASTIASQSLFYREEEYPDDLRVMEYTVLHLPRKIENGSSLDVRVMFPNGLDYIILSKKQVVDQARGENGQADMIWFHLNEEEILRMASAMVDASLIEGSRLYAVAYVAPDVQKEALTTYPANADVLTLIQNNPNIVVKAIETLEARNRQAFEERINDQRKQAGKSEVFGPEATTSQPVYAAPQVEGQKASQEEAVQKQAPDSAESGGGVDGRL